MQIEFVFKFQNIHAKLSHDRSLRNLVPNYYLIFETMITNFYLSNYIMKM